MRNTLLLFTALSLLLCLSNPAAAKPPKHDGFYRRDGQMHLLRNGQLRPMTRDARLPTGLLVTKDGFVVDTKGRRTELREGQGCDLKGNVVAVAPAKDGRLALAARPERRPTPDRRAEDEPAVGSVLDELFGQGQVREPEDRDDDKGASKAEEKRRKHTKKRQSQLRKWLEKHGRGRRDDD